jgi:integrase
LLLLGFAGALRRAELVGLNIADLNWTKAELRLKILKSKTDQERTGQIIAIAPGKTACPIKALKTWLAAAEITSGRHGELFGNQFRSECVVGLRGLELRANHAVAIEPISGRGPSGGFSCDQMSLNCRRTPRKDWQSAAKGAVLSEIF